MKDSTVPSKRSRAPSFADKNSKSGFLFAASDCSPPLKETAFHVSVDNFLEECRFCRKNLCENKDLFMYGHFGAFCSKECRAKQMALDIFTWGDMEKATKKGRTVPKQSNKVDEEEEALGIPERITSPSPPQFYI